MALVSPNNNAIVVPCLLQEEEGTLALGGRKDATKRYNIFSSLVI